MGSFVLGFAAALVLNRQFIGRGVIRAILLIPYVISAVAAAYVWKWMLHSPTMAWSAALLKQLGRDRPEPGNFLDNKNRVLPTVIVVNIWKEFSFVMIMMIAGLQTVPRDCCARPGSMARGRGSGSGISRCRTSRTSILITTLLLLVANLNSFTLVILMTGGGPANASRLWITQIYTIAFGADAIRLASAYSVILFLVMIGAGWYYVRILTQGDSKRSNA